MLTTFFSLVECFDHDLFRQALDFYKSDILEQATSLTNASNRFFTSGNTSYTDFLRNLNDATDIQKNYWETVKNSDRNVLFDYVWLVCFFERPLNADEQNIFEEQVVGFFRQFILPNFADSTNERIKDLNYLFDGLCVEFQAYMPIGDERWYSEFRAVIVKFHSQYVPISSFQGHKFSVVE